EALIQTLAACGIRHDTTLLPKGDNILLYTSTLDTTPLVGRVEPGRHTHHTPRDS
ncbi:hypothetical protein KIPB_017303, partial [Kipferlia bialata]